MFNHTKVLSYTDTVLSHFPYTCMFTGTQKGACMKCCRLKTPTPMGLTQESSLTKLLIACIQRQVLDNQI